VRVALAGIAARYFARRLTSFAAETVSICVESMRIATNYLDRAAHVGAINIRWVWRHAAA
jgi:hypothetical protein